MKTDFSLPHIIFDILLLHDCARNYLRIFLWFSMTEIIVKSTRANLASSSKFFKCPWQSSPWMFYLSSVSKFNCLSPKYGSGLGLVTKEICAKAEVKQQSLYSEGQCRTWGAVAAHAHFADVLAHLKSGQRPGVKLFQNSWIFFGFSESWARCIAALWLS